MKKLGTLLGIVAALLAVVAVVLTYLLFERRQEFRDRADRLAGTVAAMVKNLDHESGTRHASELTFQPGEPSKPGTGTLGYEAYHEAKGEDGTYASFDQRLQQAEKLAADLNARRNELADTVIALANEFKMPETMYSASDLKDLADVDDYQKTKDKIFNLVNALSARDDAMIEAFVASGNIIGYNVTTGKFKEREQIVDEQGNLKLGEFQAQSVLNEFTDRIRALNTRSNEYAQTLVQGMEIVNNHQWDASANQIKSATNYTGALTNLLNDFEEINQQLALYETTKRRLDDTRLEMTKLEDELELTRQQLHDITRRTAPGRQDSEIDEAVAEVARRPENLIGHVVSVNKEWNFVILDLGQNELQEGREMLVARENDFVAKIQISKVMRDVSVAEVKPEIQASDIRVGDRVIFPLSETQQ